MPCCHGTSAPLSGRHWCSLGAEQSTRVEDAKGLSLLFPPIRRQPCINANCTHLSIALSLPFWYGLWIPSHPARHKPDHLLTPHSASPPFQPLQSRHLLPLEARSRGSNKSQLGPEREREREREGGACGWVLSEEAQRHHLSHLPRPEGIGQLLTRIGCLTDQVCQCYLVAFSFHSALQLFRSIWSALSRLAASSKQSLSVCSVGLFCPHGLPLAFLPIALVSMGNTCTTRLVCVGMNCPNMVGWTHGPTGLPGLPTRADCSAHSGAR
ncbi:unnamed protein product [Protopolystoma xenopodis]|uniref:Uncharacterized protein n=1 Tax=Protopolystoma xenopodis TaxID=117903 RepID=A0A3S5AT72_9PLAT|nr:unnamed protein product [Protopolystoma xenopodis]